MSAIPENFIFRFGFSIRSLATFPDQPMVEMLDDSYRVPLIFRFPIRASFPKSNSSTDQRYALAPVPLSPEITFDFRMGWHVSGLAITLSLSGKQRPLVGDPHRLETSDGLHLCVDTRDIRDVHRATRFCHRFFILPCATEAKMTTPTPFWLPIHRAKSHPNPVDVTKFRISDQLEPSGYRLALLIPGETLTGYHPLEHSRLGLHFAWSDSEWGYISLQHSPFFPVEEDPSLWTSVELMAPTYSPDTRKQL